jgi:hypothetical protein
MRDGTYKTAGTVRHSFQLRRLVAFSFSEILNYIEVQYDHILAEESRIKRESPTCLANSTEELHLTSLLRQYR